jgi:ribonuclease BN (tRNA processing enzyme)
MTKLTILGGSAAGVGTGQGCAGSLVEHDGTRVVLDLGPNTLLELREHADIRNLDAIVISHVHLDHILDLFALKYASYAPVKMTKKLPVWLPPGGLAFLQKAAEVFAWEGDPETFFTSIFDLREYDPDGTTTIGNLAITHQLTAHSIPCWSMRVAVAGKGDLVYTADTSDIERLKTFADGARVLLSEATMPETPAGSGTRPHISAEEAGLLATSIGAQTLILTHIWEEYDPQRAAAQAATVFPGEIMLARPGVEVSW